METNEKSFVNFDDFLELADRKYNSANFPIEDYDRYLFLYDQILESLGKKNLSLADDRDDLRLDSDHFGKMIFDKKEYTIHFKNISFSGACFFLMDEIHLLKTNEIQIDLIGDLKIKIDSKRKSMFPASVLNCFDPKMRLYGVKFINSDQNNKLLLKKILSYLFELTILKAEKKKK